ncbi:MAG TPA: preprotein translocase subunit SecG [Gemmatimonadales bacterium]|nr:preprotein translocase subunit SecG [Gemmatimonadales bacterium]
MYAFLLVLMILDGLLLAAVVLLQAGQGGGLASLGGGTTDLVVGGRQAATLLTKMSWICGGLFMALALIISLVAPAQGGGSSEVLERIRQSQTAAPASSLPIQTAPTTAPQTTPAPPTTQAPAPAQAPSGATPAPAKPNN